MNMEKHFGGLRCTHKKHGVELIGKDEMGQFKTRQAQSYPWEMCERMALMYVDALLERKP